MTQAETLAAQASPAARRRELLRTGKGTSLRAPPAVGRAPPARAAVPPERRGGGALGVGLPAAPARAYGIGVGEGPPPPMLRARGAARESGGRTRAPPHSGLERSMAGTRGGPETRRGRRAPWAVASLAMARLTAGAPLQLPQGCSLWEVKDMAGGDVFMS